jgi:hypothetical protein
MMLSDKSASRLREEFARFSPEGSMKECLDSLSEVIARILSAKGCSILILSECDLSQTPLDSGPQFGPLPELLANQKPVIYAATVGEPSAASERTYDIHGTTESMVSAIVLQGKIVGVIHASLSLQPGGFKEEDLHLFSVLTPLVTKSIQVIQLQNILNSRFAQLAIAQSSESAIKQLMNGIMQNPNQFARMLARAFYREMLHTGLSVNQIIFVATELISELSSSLKKRSVKHKKQTGELPLAAPLPAHAGPEQLVAEHAIKQ